MTEQHMRKLIVNALKPLGAFAVENPANPGTPDVCTVLGWLELKVVRKLPARARTRVSIDLRKGQRIWLRRWCRSGGKAWTITFIVGHNEWLMHDGRWAALHLGVAGIEELQNAALFRWSGSICPVELMDAMKIWRMQ